MKLTARKKRTWKIPELPGFDSTTNDTCGICHKPISIGQRVYLYTSRELAHIVCGTGGLTKPLIVPTTRLNWHSGKYWR